MSAPHALLQPPAARGATDPSPGGAANEYEAQLFSRRMMIRGVLFVMCSVLMCLVRHNMAKDVKYMFVRRLNETFGEFTARR